MKHFKIILVGIILLMLPVAVSAQSNIYDKYNDKSNVSSIYISKTMLEMQPGVYTKDVNIGKVAGKLEAVYIVSTMDKTVRRGMSSDIAEFIKKGKYEVLMKQKGNVASSSFYVKKKGDKVKELIMISDDPAKLSYIHLVGEMTLQDIQNITSSQRMSHNLYYPLQDIFVSKLENIDLSWVEENIRNWQDDLQEKFKNINFSGGVSIEL